MTSEERLADAIATHPRLWHAMGVARQRRNVDAWTDGNYQGFLRALCIVGGFDQQLVDTKLEEEFGG